MRRTVRLSGKARFLLLLVLLLLGGAARPGLAQSPAQPVFVVTGVDVSSFPEIRVTAFGANLGDALANLPTLLREDGIEQPILTSEPVAVGIATGFLVDASSNIRDPGNTGDLRYVEIANAVNRLVQLGQLSADTDWLAAYAVDATGTGFAELADWNQDHQAVGNELRSYEPQELSIRTPLFNLIKYGLDQIDVAPIPENVRRSLVVFSDGSDSLSAVQIDDVVNRANRQGVTIHTVMVGPEVPESRQNLQRIADVTGGQYVHYTALEAIEPLWNRLVAERQQQQYTYRLAEAQPARVEVTVSTPNGRSFADDAAFPVVPAQPATIAVSQPAPDSSIARTGDTPEAAVAALTPTTLPIQLEIQWPDRHPRAFARIEYEIGGKTQTVTSEPFTPVEFPIAGLDAGFYTLRVLAIDELGIESKAAPVSFEITVTRPTPPPTPEPDIAMPAPATTDVTGDTATPAPAGETSAPVSATAEATGEVVSQVVTLTGSDSGATGDAAWVPGPSFSLPFLDLAVVYGTAGGERQLRIGERIVPINAMTVSLATFPLLLLIGLLLLAGRRQRPAPEALAPARYGPATGDNISTVVDATAYDELTEDATEAQPIVDFEAPATLVYVDGGENLPPKLPIEGGREVRIGRKAAYCDVLIDDQRVSRLHASIQEKEDGNFYIKDEGSAGGTFVNRRKLRVNDSRKLNHGDIVNFNTVAYRFELAESGEAGAPGTP